MKKEMKALVKMKQGPGNIEIVNVPVPTPKANEALVEIRHAAICGTDLHIYEWNPWAARTYSIPGYLGHEFCGEVVSLGANVRNVKLGDKVTIETHLGCGQCIQCQTGNENICQNLKVFSKLGLGCFSEYTAVPQSMLRVIPDDISFLHGAIMEPLGISLRAVYQADVAGKDIWVIGCGPIGLFTIAVAKSYGANRILATDVAANRLKIAEKVGADSVFNPTLESAPAFILNKTCKNGVETIIETSGNTPAIQECFSALRPGGSVFLVGLPSNPVTLDLVQDVVLREANIKGLYGREHNKTWIQTEKLLLSGRANIDPVLTHQYALKEFRKAFKKASSGNSGKVSFAVGKN